MAVLVARGIFAPVSYDANSTAPDAGREYGVVGEILVPAVCTHLRGVLSWNDAEHTWDCHCTDPA